jgi:hypothetical protein
MILIDWLIDWLIDRSIYVQRVVFHPYPGREHVHQYMYKMQNWQMKFVTTYIKPGEITLDT